MGFLKELIHKDMQVDHPKIKRIFDHEDEWTKYLMTLTDKQLERKINIINLQLPMALEQQKFVELDYLYLFKQLIFQVRIRKNEIECETGIYEEDIEEKTERKRKPKSERKTEITSSVEEETQTIEEDTDEQDETAFIKQLSLF